MKVTNKHNLPSPIVNAAVAALRRPPGLYRTTVTTLIKPPRVVAMERERWDDLEIDAMDLVHSIWGTAIHHVLEQHDDDAQQKVGRLRTKVDSWEISGQIDRLTGDGVLQDWKTCPVWSVIYGKEEWAQQLNLYAHLLRAHGYKVGRAEIVAFLKDWNRNGALKHDYPQNPVVTVSAPLWLEAEVLSFLTTRIALHAAAAVELPECSPEERWARPDTWAVVKVGNKRAARVLASEAEAAAWIGANEGGGKYEIQYRRGDSIRCRSYCSVSSICTQWAKLKEELDGNDDDHG